MMAFYSSAFLPVRTCELKREVNFRMTERSGTKRSLKFRFRFNAVIIIKVDLRDPSIK